MYLRQRSGTAGEMETLSRKALGGGSRGFRRGAVPNATIP